jgi:hypothetical protein
MARELSHVREHPIAGDVIECRFGNAGEEADTMIRVLCVVEEHVGYKQYGLGRFWKHLPSWRAWIGSSQLTKLVRPGDHDCPF